MTKVTRETAKGTNAGITWIIARDEKQKDVGCVGLIDFREESLQARLAMKLFKAVGEFFKAEDERNEANKKKI